MSDVNEAAERIVLGELRRALEQARDFVGDKSARDFSGCVDKVLAEFVGNCGHFDHGARCQCENDE